MSIITFANKGIREKGQTLSAAAFAAKLSIDHNYKILFISTDFNDDTVLKAFFKDEVKNKKQNNNPLYQGSKPTDVSNGVEGLVRMFSSNRADGDMIKNYAKPAMVDNRLDILAAPKTKDLSAYYQVANYYSQIAEFANTFYDVVIVDLANKIPDEYQMKIFNLSSLIVISLRQAQEELDNFLQLKAENEFYRKNNVAIALGNYYKESRFTDKNVARYLKEKKYPFVFPHSIQFSDACSEGNILDYIVKIKALEGDLREDGYFYTKLNKTTEDIDYRRKEVDMGID
jgi:cellulose biosynthesis protein BcsQ